MPSIWTAYDKEVDILYKKPSHANVAELTDDDIIIKYNEREIVEIGNENKKHNLMQHSHAWRPLHGHRKGITDMHMNVLRSPNSPAIFFCMSSRTSS